jgi:predicted dehydrogenase
MGTMSASVIRVGVVGAGGNTRLRHIPGLQAIPGVEVVSVANRTRESSEQAARQFGIPKVYDTWRDLVEADDTDAIVIGTWPYMHSTVSIAALEAGKHVMCEARMAANAAQARAMRDAARERPSIVAQVVPSPFTLRVDRTVQRLIAEGYLGDLYTVEARVGGTFADLDSPLHWRQDMDLSGLNVMTLGIWYEAVMRWVGVATRVQAMGKVFVRMRKDAGGVLRAVRIPDHVDVVCDMACGAQAHFQVSAVEGLAGPPEVWLFGSQGTLRFSDDRLYGGRRGGSGLAEITIPQEEAGGWRVEQEFVDAVRGVAPITHTTFEDGLKYMEWTEAVALSIQRGEAIGLPLLPSA